MSRQQEDASSRPWGDDNAGNNPQEFLEGDRPMETNGNQDTMNINHMLLGNIRNSDYFKLLADLNTFDAVIDQIYYDVQYITPWVPGTHNTLSTTGMCGAIRGVSAAGRCSSAFTLLFKLFTLKISGKQLASMISHPDSPYIRVLGFLYIRYTCTPKAIWSWIESFLADEEEFFVQGEKFNDTTNIGQFIRQIFTPTLEFHDTMLPRIPIPIMKTITQNIKAFDEAHPGNPGLDRGGAAYREKSAFADERDTSRGGDRDRDRRDRDRDRSGGGRDEDRRRDAGRDRREERDERDRRSEREEHRGGGGRDGARRREERDERGDARDRGRAHDRRARPTEEGERYEREPRGGRREGEREPRREERRHEGRREEERRRERERSPRRQRARS